MKKASCLYLLSLPFILCLVVVNGFAQASGRVPYMTTKPSAVPDFGNVYISNNSDYKYFALFGVDLDSEVTVGPCGGYSFSLTPGGTYSPTVTVSPSNGSITQHIYIKFSPEAAKIYSSEIPVTGGGAMSFNVAASGTGVSKLSPSLLTKLSIQLLKDEPGKRTSVDGLTVAFSDRFSDEIGDDDSYKFINPKENIAIDRNGTMLSIEGRPLVSAVDTLPLKIWKLEQEKYYLKVAASNFPPTVSAALKDAYLNIETPLNLSSPTVVSFSNDPASFSPGRFSIVLRAGGILPVTLTSVKAYYNDKGTKVDWIVETEVNIASYEVEKSGNGQQFEKAVILEPKVNNAITQSYTWLDANVSTGKTFYRIKVTEKSGTVKYSQVIKVNQRENNSSFAVFPNPVKGNLIGLRVRNSDEGPYKISLYNSEGQQVFSGLINHPGGSATYSISIGKKLSRGIYRLFVNKGELIISKMVMIAE